MKVSKNITTGDFDEFTAAMKALRADGKTREVHFSGGITKEPKSGEFQENYHVSWTDDEKL